MHLHSEVLGFGGLHHRNLGETQSITAQNIMFCFICFKNRSRTTIWVQTPSRFLLFSIGLLKVSLPHLIQQPRFTFPVATLQSNHFCSAEVTILFSCSDVTVLVVFKLLSQVRLLQPHGQRRLAGHSAWDSPDKNTGVGCYFLLQGIFPTQELNPDFLHYR